TNRYAKPSLRAARRLLSRYLEVLAPARVWGFESPPSHQSRSHTGIASPDSSSELPLGEALRAAALALLEQAADGEVDPAELRAFAVASLQWPHFGPQHARLVHAVLVGGPHTPRRVFELAQLVASHVDAALLEEGGR